MKNCFELDVGVLSSVKSSAEYAENAEDMLDSEFVSDKVELRLILKVLQNERKKKKKSTRHDFSGSIVVIE